MIERYSIAASSQSLAERFSADVPDFYRPRYNAAPAQLLPVLLLYSRGFSFFYWGESPQWAKNKSISEKWINVRAEQIEERPLLQKVLKKNRCLVPADGFYVWKKSGKKSQIPYRFAPKAGEVFSIPGLWEEYEDEQGESFHTFTLITTEVKNHPVAERVPVIFDPKKESQWLNSNTSSEELIALLNAPLLSEFDHFSVAPRLNTIAIDDKSLILPAPAADQFGNLSLFD